MIMTVTTPKTATTATTATTAKTATTFMRVAVINHDPSHCKESDTDLASHLKSGTLGGHR